MSVYNKSFDSLAALKDGWFDEAKGEGKAIKPEWLTMVREWLETLLTQGHPRGHVYPTLDGGVRVEWSISGRELSLETVETMVNINSLDCATGAWADISVETLEAPTLLTTLVMRNLTPFLEVPTP